jgi:hypothetical protein
MQQLFSLLQMHHSSTKLNNKNEFIVATQAPRMVLLWTLQHPMIYFNLAKLNLGFGVNVMKLALHAYLLWLRQ